MAIGPTWLVVAGVVGLLFARLVAATFGQIFEGDAISISAGVAALVGDTPGVLYRYAPQVGYYQLVAFLTRLLGGDLILIPTIMITLSVIAGTVIPLCGLYAFADERSRLERWVTAFVLAVNPIVWMSARYGNTAMTSTALVAVAVTLLSNRPRARIEALALVLFAAAIIVRADAVLATAGIGVLLWRNHGRLAPAIWRGAAVGLGVAAVFGLLLALDPRMRDVVGSVSSHFTDEFPTRFWEFLPWAFSPFALLFAAWGLVVLAHIRRWTLGFILAAAVPVVAFYAPETTTPRYFLLTVFPVSLATASGMTHLMRLGMRPGGRLRPAAVAAVLGAASLHLAVALGWFVLDRPGATVLDTSLASHDGPLWTGALLSMSYRNNRVVGAPVWHSRMGRTTARELTISTAMDSLGHGRRRGRSVVLVSDPFHADMVHFLAHVAGARILGRGEGYGAHGKFAMELGGARLTTLGLLEMRRDSSVQVPVHAGDELWVVERDSLASAAIPSRMPRGVTLHPLPPMPDAPNLKRFRVEPST